MKNGAHRSLTVAACASASWMITAFVVCAASRDASFVREINLSAGASGRLAAVELDENIFAETADGYSDVAILDGDDRDVPCLVQVKKVERPVVEEARIETRVVRNQTLENNRTECVVEKKGEGKPFVVVISTRSQNFEKRAEVFGSMDGARWEVISLETPVFDDAAISGLRNDRIRLMAADHRFLKVVLSDFPDGRVGPLACIMKEIQVADGGDQSNRVIETAEVKIDSVFLLENRQGETKSVEASQSYPIYGISCENDAGRRETVVTLRTRRIPLTSLTLFTGNSNFRRDVTVYGSNCETPGKERPDGSEVWEKIASGTISKIHLPGLRREEATVRFGKSVRFRWYMIVAGDAGGSPLRVYGAKAEGDIYEAVFLPISGTRYKMLYGSNVSLSGTHKSDTVSGGRKEWLESFSRKSVSQGRPFLYQRSHWSPRGVLRTAFPSAAIVVMLWTLIWVIVKGIDAGKRNARAGRR